MWTIDPAASEFLGATTPLGSAQANTPTIVFGPGWGMLFIHIYIAGYSGGSIATIQLGTGTTVDTGTNYSAGTAHFVMGGTTVGTSTSRVSQTGVQVANDSVTNGRRGVAVIANPSGAPKTLITQIATFSAQSPTSAATSYSTLSNVVGMWSNTSQAQCIAMSGAGVNLNTGSFISVYGTPGTG